MLLTASEKERVLERKEVNRCSIFRVRKGKEPSGGVAQLGEHLPCKQGVKSSNLFISTRGEKCRTIDWLIAQQARARA